MLELPKGELPVNAVASAVRNYRRGEYREENVRRAIDRFAYGSTIARLPSPNWRGLLTLC